jgi:hypothetical protein
VKFRIANWEKFQHYRYRNPPWIKLHRALLDDYEFHSLPDASRALAPLLWLLASESEDGSIIGTWESLAFRLHTTPHKIEDACKPLIEKGFIEDASGVLAEGLQGASNVHQCEPVEHSVSVYLSSSEFDEFWKKYPRKRAKADARKAWKKLRHVDLKTIMVALEAAIASDEWRRDSGQFIPYPTTWLNGERWTDELTKTGDLQKIETGVDRRAVLTDEGREMYRRIGVQM